MKLTLNQRRLQGLVATGLFALASVAQAQAQEPNAFVDQVAQQALSAVKQSPAARNGDMAEINRLIEQHIVPYVNMDKTTRLAVGQPWRQATPEQRQALVDGFTNTLVRTYSGGLKHVTDSTEIRIMPFRGDPQANDVVVRSTISTGNEHFAVDYRLERAGDSWKVYDLNVEGIWLIQNYRSQFSGAINRGGIDGLIQQLQRNEIAPSQ